MKPLFAFLCVCLFATALNAQKLKTVEATYTYHAPENVTLEQARRTALERAMLQAIADEFGTIVSQSTSTRIDNRNGQSDLDFTSIGGSEVKGEWIETIGQPEYNISYEGEMLVVTCHVKGKVREILTASIDFTAKILRNGTEDKFESDQFRCGDDLYLSFLSPVAGYLAVYLVDADGQAFCLLPYQSQQTGIYPIEANRRYLFFNTKEAPQQERHLVDEYTMTCTHSSEHNQIYIIFSPNQFAKAADAGISESLPRQLSFDDFHKWMAGCRKHDKEMNLRKFSINIKN